MLLSDIAPDPHWIPGTHRYRVHGITVDSDLDLYLPVDHRGGEASLVLRRGPWLDEPWCPTDDEQMAVLHDGDRLRYRAGRTPSGFRLRFENVCDFDLSADLTSVCWRLSPAGTPGLAAVLAAGALLAFRLSVAGEHVLHASAVVIGEQTIALVAASGMGKTTMAALLCAAGATFLTDDVLRLDHLRRGAVPLAFPGSSEVRLRPSSTDLADRFEGRSTRYTDDGRTALQLPVQTGEAVPLAAVVVPLPDRQGGPLAVERLSTESALATLGGFPRLPGWTDRDVRRQQFLHLAELVATVPVYRATIPWGPPFDDRVAHALIRRVMDR